MIWSIVIGIAIALAITHKTTNVFRPTIQAVIGIDERGHARRIKEGYILSGMFNESHVSRIVQQGVKLVVSLARPSDIAISALERNRILHFPAYLGSRFRYGREIHNIVSQYDPEQVMIHCEHGVDRTGNVTAYLLHAFHDYTIPHALYAVVNPVDSDIQALNSILRNYGFFETPVEIGKYSLRPIGKYGGMKVRGNYGQMVEQNIQAMREL